MLNWRKSTKNIKSSCTPRWHCKRRFRILCSIYSLKKDLQDLKWQQLRSCILSQDCLVAQDKQLTQYLLIRRSKWKMFKNFENSKFGVSRHLDSSTTTQDGQNHGPVWKTQSFILSAIFTFILWKDCYVKGNLRKYFWNTVGRRFPVGNAYTYTVKKGYSYLCMWMTSNWLEGNKTLIRCGMYWMKNSMWEIQHLSLIMYIWCALKDNVK